MQDDGWSRFKSGYKLIQYMAAGRASVASPIGANCDVVVAEKTGLFATHDEEWYSQINRLRKTQTCGDGSGGRLACAARRSFRSKRSARSYRS